MGWTASSVAGPLEASPYDEGEMIGFVVFGLVVGALARLLVPGRQDISHAMTLLLGVIGSVVGGVVANALGTGDAFELNVVGSIVAIAASVTLVVAWVRIGGIRRRWGRRSGRS